MGKRTSHAADRVHVFDLDLRAECAFVFRPNRNIAVATQLPFFHVGVAYRSVDQDLLQSS